MKTLKQHQQDFEQEVVALEEKILEYLNTADSSRYPLTNLVAIDIPRALFTPSRPSHISIVKSWAHKQGGSLTNYSYKTSSDSYTLEFIAGY
jgi:hypothetical protein